MNAVIFAWALVGPLFAIQAAADWQPNFSETCSDIVWEQDYDNSAVILVANCELSGGTVTSSLDLNACLAVDANTGMLVGKDNGNFGDLCACGDDYQTTAGSTLKCSCKTSDGGFVTATFDLDQAVGNTAGTLYCYSTLGFVAPA